MGLLEKRYYGVLSGVVFSVAGIIALLVTAAIGFVGEPNICYLTNECHCEFINKSAMIAQPINTWSNLFYVFFGLLILWKAAKDPPKHNGNKMVGVTPLSTAFGLIAISIGIGSMFFHASMTNWGGALDVCAMNLFLSFVLVYTMNKFLRGSTKSFWISYLLLNSACIILRVLSVAGLQVFTIMLFTTVALEVILLIAGYFVNEKDSKANNKGIIYFPLRNWKLLIATLVSFGGGYVIWNLYQDTSPLCDPYSGFQGHAIWHFLTALATWYAFLYLRSEKGQYILRPVKSQVTNTIVKKETRER